MSQRPDLTPTLESAGSEAMMGEGLSPNQRNKPKTNRPTQPCCVIITPEDRLELKIMGPRLLKNLLRAPT